MGRRVGAWLVAAVVTVALVAGAVLVAGGGRDRSPAVLPALDLGAEGTAVAAASADAAREPAAAEPAPAGSGGGAPASRGGAATVRPSDPDLPLWPAVTYRLAGPLPTLPDRARAWRVTNDAGADRVAALAAALGLRGRPREDPSGWTVTDRDRSLTVNRLAGLPWSYATGVAAACAARPGGGSYRPGAGPRCLDPDAPVSNRPLPPVAVKPLLPARPGRPRDLPSREAAERVARALAARAGLELAGAEVRVTDGGADRLVTIDPVVGGLPTSGFGWRVGVGPGGAVRHASGWLATPEPADTYPLIGVEAGFERLRRSPPIGPVLRADGPVAPAIERFPCPAGGKIPCLARPLPKRVATVTGVRLGLRLAPALPEGGRPAELGYLLPAYLFDLDGGWTEVRAIVAVQDRYLTRP